LSNSPNGWTRWISGTTLPSGQVPPSLSIAKGRLAKIAYFDVFNTILFTESLFNSSDRLEPYQP
jgi:hypothetical protein